MKTSGRQLQRSLDSVMPGAVVTCDYKPDGEADAVLLVDRRLQVWSWMKRRTETGHWVIIGDMNMVEQRSDTLGPSPLLKGRELRKWALCSNQGDLSDGWLMAVQAKGPWFTRQAVYGNRIDQARLDRCYLSERGEWAFMVSEMEHYGACSLSDHVPVRIAIILEGERREDRRKSYFKMGANSMKNSETVEAVRQAWGRHPAWAKEDRRRWVMAWDRVREVLIQQKDRQHRELPEAETIQRRLEWAREMIQFNTRNNYGRRHDYGGNRDFIQTALHGGGGTAEVYRKRAEVLVLVDRKLTVEQNRKLSERPSEQLIEEVVRSLPKEKSPGYDGVVAEILVAGWEFMKHDCFKMVGHVWRMQRLLQRDSRGIIKLIPKAEDLFLLKNWRPITLLTLTYKIIAKILAWRLREMLPSIIDQQQTGFIAGRSRVDNILSLRLAQDWVQESEQNMMFIKLDFQKAYDRVSHTYLWETLTALGVEEDNLKMIQGMVTGGSAQVHVNCFTGRFQVERGVLQGCPLAPLLFAMTTQPLMRLLRTEESAGRLKGVCYGGESTLLHQIYADDTGINITLCEEQFARLRQVIHDFEQVSGVKLNVNKSMIMPIRPSAPLAWVQETGCDIAAEGKTFVYLGVCTSNPVDEKQVTKSIVKKMENKLRHWSNRFLSWPARTLLLKHVLNATPLYQLLSVGLNRDGLEELERLCRQFLWGWSEIGGPKAALIAWERITQSKVNGGIGLTQLKDRAQAMYVKNMVKILSGHNAEWVGLAKNLILRTLRKGSYQRERRQWRLADSLFLLRIWKIKSSGLLTRMCQAWCKMWKKIKWDDRSREIPRHLTVAQGVHLMTWDNAARFKEMQSIVAVLRKAGITTIIHGKEILNNQQSWQDRLGETRIFLEELEAQKLRELERWTVSKQLVDKQLRETKGWVWKEDGAEVFWEAPTNEWVQRIGTKEHYSDYLDEKLGRGDHAVGWKKRWQALWHSPITYRRKIWLWRLLQRGFFVNSRWSGRGEEEKRCQACGLREETLEHTFWECSRLTQRWNDLAICGILQPPPASLIEWIDQALHNAKTDSSLFFTVGFVLKQTWMERNHLKFRGSLARLPVRVILEETRREIDAFPGPTCSENTLNISKKALEIVDRWRLTWGSQLTSSSRFTLEEVMTHPGRASLSDLQGSESAAGDDNETSSGTEEESADGPTSRGSEDDTSTGDHELGG
ncbi:hypothetical protein R1sor_025529 [Riccia sorocarpa]|uniref:Reverse transcriptase domain-containing protein n=1 Tax=Riccia sorocarpa TaxID=122646 RepID=A0ABD3GCJ8_9MARC